MYRSLIKVLFSSLVSGFGTSFFTCCGPITPFFAIEFRGEVRQSLSDWPLVESVPIDYHSGWTGYGTRESRSTPDFLT